MSAVVTVGVIKLLRTRVFNESYILFDYLVPRSAS
nr:MAG TPA: hypothetical protein [Crassvirales sp.]